MEAERAKADKNPQFYLFLHKDLCLIAGVVQLHEYMLQSSGMKAAPQIVNI